MPRGKQMSSPEPEELIDEDEEVDDQLGVYILRVAMAATRYMGLSGAVEENVMRPFGNVLRNSLRNLCDAYGSTNLVAELESVMTRQSHLMERAKIHLSLHNGHLPKRLLNLRHIQEAFKRAAEEGGQYKVYTGQMDEIVREFYELIRIVESMKGINKDQENELEAQRKVSTANFARLLDATVFTSKYGFVEVMEKAIAETNDPEIERISERHELNDQTEETEQDMPILEEETSTSKIASPILLTNRQNDCFVNVCMWMLSEMITGSELRSSIRPNTGHMQYIEEVLYILETPKRHSTAELRYLDGTKAQYRMGMHDAGEFFEDFVCLLPEAIKEAIGIVVADSIQCETCSKKEIRRHQDDNGILAKIMLFGDNGTIQDGIYECMPSSESTRKEYCRSCQMTTDQLIRTEYTAGEYIIIDFMQNNFMKKQITNDMEIEICGSLWEIHGAVQYMGNGEAGHYMYYARRDEGYLIHDDQKEYFELVPNLLTPTYYNGTTMLVLRKIYQKEISNEEPEEDIIDIENIDEPEPIRHSEEVNTQTIDSSTQANIGNEKNNSAALSCLTGKFFRNWRFHHNANKRRLQKRTLKPKRKEIKPTSENIHECPPGTSPSPNVIVSNESREEYNVFDSPTLLEIRFELPETIEESLSRKRKIASRGEHDPPSKRSRLEEN